MSSYALPSDEWLKLQVYIMQLEEEGLVTRTFRRLDPPRQQAVLQAILDEATEKGPAKMSIKEVAHRADVSVGSLYTYFPDRDGMLAFAVELCVRYVCAAFDEFRPLLSALPLQQGLAAYLLGGIEWSKTQAGMLQLFARAAYQGDPELADRLVKPIADALRITVHDMLTAAAGRGEIRPEIDLEATARLVHALMIAAGDSLLLPYLNNYFQVIDPNTSVEQLSQALETLILNGIGIQP